jgi:hypothetical protein
VSAAIASVQPLSVSLNTFVDRLLLRASAHDDDAAADGMWQTVSDLAAAFGLGIDRAPVGSLDDALSRVLPADKKCPTARLVRSALAAELLVDAGQHWHRYFAEQWLLPQFRSAVRAWETDGKSQDPLVAVALAAAASAYSAAIVVLCAQTPFVRVSVPARSGIDCVVWLAMDDTCFSPRFAAVRPTADGEAASLLESSSALIRLQLGITSDLLNCDSAAAASSTTDEDGDCTMAPADGKGDGKVRAALLVDVSLCCCASRSTPRAALIFWRCAAW